jgi:hypothetical protein
MFVSHLVDFLTSANENDVVIVQLPVLQKVVEVLGTHPLSTVNVKAVLFFAPFEHPNVFHFRLLKKCRHQT